MSDSEGADALAGPIAADDAPAVIGWQRAPSLRSGYPAGQGRTQSPEEEQGEEARGSAPQASGPGPGDVNSESATRPAVGEDHKSSVYKAPCAQRGMTFVEREPASEVERLGTLPSWVCSLLVEFKLLSGGDPREA